MILIWLNPIKKAPTTSRVSDGTQQSFIRGSTATLPPKIQVLTEKVPLSYTFYRRPLRDIKSHAERYIGERSFSLSRNNNNNNNISFICMTIIMYTLFIYIRIYFIRISRLKCEFTEKL